MGFDLQNRFIEFAVLIIPIANGTLKTRAGFHLSKQLNRSDTSAALNYGEAQSGESRRDFIHKLKLVLKKLRETFVCLKILRQANLFKNEQLLSKALCETDELIAILVKSIKTASDNLNSP